MVIFETWNIIVLSPYRGALFIFIAKAFDILLTTYFYKREIL